MKITVRSQQENGSTRWVLDYTPEGGKRVRRFFKSKTDADAAAKEQQTMVNRAGQDWLALSTAERADLITGYAEIKRKGLTLHQVLEQWRNGTASKADIVPITLGACVDAWVKDLRDAQWRERYVSSCESFGRQFAEGRTEFPMAKIGLPECKAFLAAGGFTGWTFNTYRDRLRAFLTFAARHKFMAESPLKDGKMLPKVTVDFVHPIIWTPEQMEKALQWIWAHDRDLLAWFALACFQGTRPEELDRIDWNAIDLDRGLMRLEANQTKDRRPRLNHLHPTLIAWLKLARDNKSPLAWNTSARLRRMKALRDALGLTEWPHDVCRHTFGSYFTELHHDVAKTSLEMGNSPKIVLRNYRELVTPEACQKFWSLTPDVVLANATK